MRYRLAFILYLLIVILLCGCGAKEPDLSETPPMPEAQAPVFQSGEHSLSADYQMRFDTRYAELEDAEFHMQANIFDADTACSLISIVTGDIKAIGNVFNLSASARIYVVSKTLEGFVYAAPGEVVCTREDIVSGNYRSGLVAAALDLTEPWQTAGAYSFVYEKRPDEAALAAYYSDLENLPVLTLFAGYFNETFADGQMLHMAKDTAASFTAYLIGHYGEKAFRECVISNEAYRQEWLASIGVSVRYMPPCDVSVLDEAQYSQTKDWPFILTIRERVYNFTVIEEQLEAPLDILMFATINESQMDGFLMMIQEQAPEAYEQIAPRAKQRITYYFTKDASKRYETALSYADSSSVYCSSLGHAVHEMMHILIQSDAPAARSWIREGLSEYFQSLAWPVKLGNYKSFTMNIDEFSGDDRTFFLLMKDYYIQKAGYPESQEVFDSSLFYEAIVAVIHEHPELDITIPVIANSVGMLELGGESPIPGNELFPAETFTFTSYLIKIYGLNPVISFAQDGSRSFEQTFGLSYEDALSTFYEGFDSEMPLI